MYTGMAASYRSLLPYEPPPWAKGLKLQPTSRVVLTQQPTPIHEWAVPGLPSGFELHVKRDDLTGSTLTGNKVRKLEFLLAEAIAQGCDTIVTVGSQQSNHARSTALAAREVGLDTHLLLRGRNQENPTDIGCRGNLLLDRLSSTRLVVVPPDSLGGGSVEEQVTVTHQLMYGVYAEQLRREGKKPYLIPAGGASPLGAWGYIECFKEMMDQGMLDRFDDVVVALGSSGTACGLAVANYLTGSKIKVHGISVDHTLEYFRQRVTEHLAALGIEGVSPDDILDLIYGYTGQGHGRSTQEELALILEVSTQTGVLLDPDFCIKALRGTLGEMRQNPARFQGRRVLFIHSGGMYSLFDGRLDKLMTETAATNQVFNFDDLIRPS